MYKLAEELYREIRQIPLLDPHSHINPHAPAAASINELLGYHYYTELAHSAGLPRDRIEEARCFEQARRLVVQLAECSNTVQYSWLVELAQAFFDFPDDRLTENNLETLFEGAEKKLGNPHWADEVCQQTNLEAIFLTNEFDDPLEGFDTERYIPCLRTDDLVFKLDQPSTRARWSNAVGLEGLDSRCLEQGLDVLFERFVSKGARACAISLPPDFAPRRPGCQQAEAALRQVVAGEPSEDEKRTVAYAVFYALADRCEEYHLPFDLMIGVWRDVYRAGVYQGRDLYDQRTSLYEFRHLFNEKAAVTFPVSVLTHPQNQELVSYAWIFPNVVTSGHWWYSNIPAYIEPDLRARLEAAPRNKQVAYYSDAYKLEFVLPKYDMYRRVLARVLAKDFVLGRGWSETQALELAHILLRDNVERIFPARNGKGRSAVSGPKTSLAFTG